MKHAIVTLDIASFSTLEWSDVLEISSRINQMMHEYPFEFEDWIIIATNEEGSYRT